MRNDLDKNTVITIMFIMVIVYSKDMKLLQIFKRKEKGVFDMGYLSCDDILMMRRDNEFYGLTGYAGLGNVFETGHCFAHKDVRQARQERSKQKKDFDLTWFRSFRN